MAESSLAASTTASTGAFRWAESSLAASTNAMVKCGATAQTTLVMKDKLNSKHMVGWRKLAMPIH